MVTYSAPGKVILFGEHSVVYGYPAIAIAIDRRITVTVTNNDKSYSTFYSSSFYPSKVFLCDSNDFKQLFPTFHFLKDGIERKHSNKSHYDIVIKSQIPIASGLGSSAATAVSFCAAISDYYNLKLSFSEINELAFEAEKIQHGSPSGIDNTIATFGGGILFEKGKLSPLEPKQLDWDLVVVDSGITRNTKGLVTKVKDNYKENPKIVQNYFNSIESIVRTGEEALKEGNIETIGSLMNQNQEILKSLGVSTNIIDEIVELLNTNCALGSKITGAGGGGCIISLFGNTDTAEKAIDILRMQGYNAFHVKFSDQGVKKE